MKKKNLGLDFELDLADILQARLIWTNVCPVGHGHRDHIYNIESLLYITAYIQGMGPFGMILAPQPIK
jgi:hypothetical protein